MKKRTKWISLAVGLILVGGGIVFGATHKGPTETRTTDVVKRGDLQQTVEVTGDTESVDELQLSFERSGTVANVSVKVGQTVTAGTVLASLNAAELQAAYAQSLGRVKEAQANLALKKAGSSDEQHAISQASVTSAEVALNAAKADAEQTKIVEAQDVKTAEDHVVQVKQEVADNLTQAQEDRGDALRALVAEVRSALGSADRVLGVENPLFNQSFKNILGAEDTGSLRDAVTAYKIAMTSRDSAEDTLFDGDISGTTAETAYDDAYELLLLTSRVLDATSANSDTLSLEDLTGYKTAIAAAQSSLMSTGSKWTAAGQAVDNAIRAVTTDVADAENALATAKAHQNQALADAQAAINARQADLDRAYAELAEALAPPRAVDLAGYEAAVSQAQADAQAALARLREAQIIAPIGGVVTAVEIDPGESAAAGASMITLRSEEGKGYEIALQIPEADVAKLAVGQKTDITFDAFGDDRVFAGTVYSIDPAETLIQDVVFYDAKVLIAAEQDVSQVKPGMSANVTIYTAERPQVLYVPTRSVLEKDGEKYVRLPLKEGEGYEERVVTVGLRADDGLTEIKSGLSEGDVIIVSIREL